MTALLLFTLPLPGAQAELTVAVCAFYEDSSTEDTYVISGRSLADPGVSPAGGVSPGLTSSVYANDDYAAGLQEIAADFSDGQQDGYGVIYVEAGESTTGASGSADTAKPRGDPRRDCPKW